MASTQISLLVQQSAHPEVAEFMVKALKEYSHSGLNAKPGSGVIYRGMTNQWVPEEQADEEINFVEIYSECIEAQNSLIQQVNKFSKIHNLPCLDDTTIHTWKELGESAVDSCDALERLNEKDKRIPPGFTGKLKQAFRTLCSNAGVGLTLTNLVPSESFGSVASGGLKIIFTALQQTNLDREEIFKALESIPGLLQHHGEMVNMNKNDELLHRRVASLYTCLFELMGTILHWLQKGKLSTGLQRVFKPAGFADDLRNSLAKIRLASQTFQERVYQISMRNQNTIIEQHKEILSEQHQGKILCLTALQLLLKNTKIEHDQGQRCRPPGLAKTQLGNPGLDIKDYFLRHKYDRNQILADCDSVIKAQNRVGSDIDEDRIVAIQSHPRFLSWLILNESSMLLMDANSASPMSHDMSFVSAKTFQHVLHVSKEQERTKMSKLIPIAFFCRLHCSDYRGPRAMPLSILFQLLDKYREFDSECLRKVFDNFNPRSIANIFSKIKYLLDQLPADVIVILIVDGLRFYARDPELRQGIKDGIQRLVRIHHKERAAILKMMFASSTRSEFVEDMFTDDETLRMPREMVGKGGYNTMAWKKPLAIRVPSHDNDKVDTNQDSE